MPIVPSPGQRRYDLRETAYVKHGASGTGTATTLPMTEAEKKTVGKRMKHPVGFAAPAKAPRQRRTPGT